MTFWESVWSHVKDEMPGLPSRSRSWPGFFGALVAAALLMAIWFPIRLIFEILKTIDFHPKPDRRTEAHELFAQAFALSRDLPSPGEFSRSVLRHVDLPRSLAATFDAALRQLYSENLLLDPPPIPDDLETLEAIRWRDQLRRAIPRYNSASLVRMRRASLGAIEACVALLPRVIADGEITAPLASLANPGRFVEALARPLNSELFPTFAELYQRNVYAVSGVTPARTGKPPKITEPHHLDDPSPFLADTPFASLLSTPLSVDIPDELRFSHHWIVAGTGAGKTTALQYLLTRDLRRAIRGECSIVVIDSQHQLIDRLASLKLFAPRQPLDGKLCLLDAADVEWPIAVNLFDMKMERLASMTMFERERITNSALEMYDFLIGSLLQAEMTSRQSTLFRFVTRAMFAIPDATIHTFYDVLTNGVGGYQASIDRLDDTTRRFFASEFNSQQFKQTKEQVVARLWAVLGNATFSRMFSNPRSKVDFFAEINTPGKVILINAEKSLLKDEGAELFGRFFLALINQAAAQRASLPPSSRLPCYVYVDECHNYIRNDPKTQVILAEARQQKIAMLLAHQYLGQIESPVLRALAANTSIKMASALEGADRAAMARDMNTTPDFIRDQPIGSFACFMRGATSQAIGMRFPFNALSKFETMTPAERAIVRQRNRDLYANPYDPSRQSSESSRQHNGSTEPPKRKRRDPD